VFTGELKLWRQRSGKFTSPNTLILNKGVRSMKTIACAAIFALFLISSANPWVTNAQSGGPTANGNYHFVLEDDLSKALEFNAATDERGTTTGVLSYSGQAKLFEGDPDEGEPREEISDFFVTATLDSLSIEHNRALMSGTVTDASNRSYIGQWVQLVVEDNGDGLEVPDQMAWRFCQQEPGGWVPVDAEDPRDEGAYWHWWATDAELRDDVGIASRNIIPGTTKGCQTLPLAAAEFAAIKGEGQILVRP
jgi:hypothetical protein